MTPTSTGFVDLRVHRATESSHSDDSIWPSFTDIMMVVSMVFLMAAVVFMLRNLQLGEDIQRAVTAETEATLEVDSLRERATYLSAIVEKTQQRLELTEAQRDEFESLSKARGVKIVRLENETLRLYQTQQQLSAELESLTQGIETLREQRNALTDRVTSMNATMSQLSDVIDSQSVELASLQDDVDRKQRELSDLELELTSKTAEYEALKSLGVRHRQEIVSLEQAKEISASELEELLERTESQSLQIAELSNQRRRQNERLQEQATRINRLQASYRESLASITTLRDEVSDRDAQLEQMTIEGAQREAVIQELQKVRSEQVSTIAVQAQSTAELREDIAGLEARGILQSETIDEQKQELADLAKLLEEGRIETQGLRQVIQRLEIENSDYRRELEFAERLQKGREEQIEALQAVMAQLSEDLQSRDRHLTELRTENQQLLKSGLTSDRELAQLRDAYQQRLQELKDLQAALQLRSGEVEQLQVELVELKEESQLLLRPARSPANRYVVEIIYAKSAAGEVNLQYRLPNQSTLFQVTRNELEAVLTRLNKDRTEGVYTKIIFPDESQLTFSEAWTFTNHIQSNYDYYWN